MDTSLKRALLERKFASGAAQLYPVSYALRAQEYFPLLLLLTFSVSALVLAFARPSRLVRTLNLATFLMGGIAAVSLGFRVYSSGAEATLPMLGGIAATVLVLALAGANSFQLKRLAAGA